MAEERTATAMRSPPSFSQALQQLLFERGGQGCGEDPFADALSAGGERGEILDVEAGKFRLDARGEPMLGQEFAESRGGGGKAIGNAHAETREACDHFAQ